MARLIRAQCRYPGRVAASTLVLFAHPMKPQPLFRPKLLDCLRGYSRTDLAADAVAGVTVGLIALPLCLALAIASGVEPVQGLYTAIIAGVVCALFGGSRVQVSGPTAAFVPIVYGIVVMHGVQNLYVCTLMAGVILVLMGVARMGTLIKFIPYPVTSGFTTGIAIVIVAAQLEDLLGLTTAGQRPAHFFPKLEFVWEFLPTFNPWAFGLGLSCIALMLLWPKYVTRRLPGPVVAVVAATLAVHWLELPVVTVGERFVAGVPQGLPAFALPPVDWATIRELVLPATAIALLCAIESLLSAVVADGLINDRHRSNTELIGQGAANIVVPFFGGIPVTGAIARTAANIESGARTPVSSLVHAATLALVVVALAPLANHIPLAAMAAVLIMVARRMGEWHELARLPRLPRSDAVVLLTTCLLTVIFDLTVAVVVGMVLAALLFMKRISETTEISRVTTSDELESEEHLVRGKDIPEGVLVYRIFGPFFFGAAEKLEDALVGLGALPRVLILRMQLVPAMDATALNALTSVVERMEAAGGRVVLSGPHRQPLEMMRRAGFVDRLGRRNIRGTFDEALARARELLAELPPVRGHTPGQPPRT
jgi:SulP family sulfate permease